MKRQILSETRSPSEQQWTLNITISNSHFLSGVTLKNEFINVNDKTLASSLKDLSN